MDISPRVVMTPVAHRVLIDLLAAYRVAIGLASLHDRRVQASEARVMRAWDCGKGEPI